MKRTRIVQTRRRTVRLIVKGVKSPGEVAGTGTPAVPLIRRLLESFWRHAGRWRNWLPCCVVCVLLSLAAGQALQGQQNFTATLDHYEVTQGIGEGPCGAPAPPLPSTMSTQSSSITIDINKLPCDTYASATGSAVLSGLPGAINLTLDTRMVNGVAVTAYFFSTPFVAILKSTVQYMTSDGLALGNAGVEVFTTNPLVTDPTVCDTIAQPVFQNNTFQPVTAEEDCSFSQYFIQSQIVGQTLVIYSGGHIGFQLDGANFEIDAYYKLSAQSVGTGAVSVMEAVQATQSFTTDTPSYAPLPLIAGKTTTIRMYPIEADPQDSVTGQIQVALGSNVLGSVRPTFPSAAPQTSVMRNNNQSPPRTSLDFQIPAGWTKQGDLTVTGQFIALQTGQTLPQNPAPLTLHFQSQAKTPFYVRYMEWCTTTIASPTNVVCPSDDKDKVRDMGDAAWYMRASYPAADDGIVYAPLLLPTLTWHKELNDDNGCNAFIANLRRWYMLLHSFGSQTDQIAAWVPSGAGTCAGGDSDPLWGNAATTLKSSIGHVTWLQDYGVYHNLDQLFAERTLAHEIGHNLGLRHTNTKDSNGADDGSSCYPYADSTIQNPGYDSIDSIFIPSSAWDFMSYHFYQPGWLTPYTYDLLLRGGFQPQTDAINRNWDPTQLKCVKGAAPVSPNATPSAVQQRLRPADAATPSDSIIISGTVTQNGSATINPSYRVSTSAALDESDPSGAYCINFNNGATTLASFCFNLSFNDVEAGALTTQSFAFAVPFPPQTSSIALVNQGTQIASFAVSKNAPSVNITSPHNGDTWNGGQQTISWTASDADGGSLIYAVLYSSDGGNTYVPLDLDLTGTQFNFDPSAIMGGSQVYFQVIASDGVNSTSATVGPINVKQTPQLVASAPTFTIGNASASSTATAIVTLVNGGSGPVTITSASIDNNAFTIDDPPMPLIIPAGRQASLTVRFAPTSTSQGTQSGAITVASNDPSSPLKVPVTGNVFASPVPNVAVTPQALNFASAAGQTQDLSIAVSNSGSANLTINSFSISNSNFVLAGLQTPLTVTPGGSQSITARFMAPNSGTQSGTVTIATNDPTTPFSFVSLTGVVLPGGAGPQISPGGVVNAAISTPVVSRGSLASIYGTNLTASAPLVAPSLPLTTSLGGTSVTVGGIPAPVYYVQPTQINFQVPFEVALGNSVPVVVTNGGLSSNTVNVAVDDYALGVFQYYRTSTVLDPIIVHTNYTLVSPASPAVPGESLIFFGTGIGKLNNQPVTGAAAGTPLATAVDNPIITVGGSPAIVQFAGLAPGFVGLVQLNFQLPSNLPTGSVPLAIQFPGDNSPAMSLYVQGNVAAGSPKISVSPNPLNFSSTTVGQPLTLPLSISNTGTAALTISNIAINPSSGSAFTVSYPALPFTLQPGASTSSLTDAGVLVTFAPTSAGTASASVVITSTDPITPFTTVGINGTAAGAASPMIAVTPSGVNFSSVAEGSSKQVKLTINNNGSAALMVTGLTAGGVFSVVSPSSFTVAPGGYSTVTLQFSPVTTGGQAANLNIASNDPVHSNVAVPIWGTGYNPANVLTSDSFNRANATECSLGVSDLKFGGTTSYYYLPDWPSNNGPIGASIVSGALQNNGFGFGGVQLAASADTCGGERGATLPQDLDMIVDIYVPGSSGKITDAGPYFRSRAAAPGDGIFGGTSSGYWVEMFSTGEVWVDQLNPFEPIAKSPLLTSFDPAIIHTLEAQVQGAGLQATLDGQLVTFTQNGAAVTTVAVSTAANDGTVGIIFGSEDNNGKAGGQTASNLIISSPASASATPQIAVSPVSLNFGNVTVGQAPTMSFSIANKGDATLNVTYFSVNATPFTVVSPTAPFNVAAGASVTVTVSFTAIAGAQTGTLTIGSNDPVNPVVTAALSGTGVPAPTPHISVSPTSLNFGNVTVGLAPTMTVTIANVGNNVLNVTSLGIDSAPFAVVSPKAPFTVAAGFNTTITVSFTSVLGTQTGTLAIVSNDPSNPTVTAALSGTGVAAAVTPSITTISPTQVTAGQSTTITINGSNFVNGLNASVTTSAGTVNVPNSAVTFVSSTQVTIQVNLPASSTYPYSATLTITNPGGQSANFTFQVTAPAGSFSISATYGYDELTALAAPGADVYNFPLISRNGNKIVFTVTSGNPAVNTVWGMNSGGSGLTMLDSDSAANPHFLSITDDGSKALVWSQNRIRLINTNGSGAATLVTVTGVPNGPGDALIHMAKITGDGSRIVFANGDIDNLTSGNNPQFIGGIYVINPDGTGLHSVVDTNSIANYLGLPAGSLRGFASLNGMDVSADGSKIVFRVTFALNGDYLIAVNQDGSGLHTIFGPITDVLTCGISGDGSTIWYNAIFAALAPNEIGTLPFGGGTRKALVSGVGNGGGGLATDLQLTANGSKLLVGDDGIGHLYNTDGSAAVSLFVTTNGVNGPVIGTNGDRLRITMDISASHFAYTVDARSLFPPVPQIALLTINQQSSGAGPVIANPSANPAYLVEKTASSTLIATITAPFAIGAVSAELLLPSGAFDGNSLNPVLAAGANNAYSGVMQGGFDGVTGPRTIRIQAEDTGADKRRHGSAVDFGPFNVVATAP